MKVFQLLLSKELMLCWKAWNLVKWNGPTFISFKFMQLISVKSLSKMNTNKVILALFGLISNISTTYPIKVGMFKIHPKVPECMSDEAKAFIMNCFTPNPDDRATATELLMDSFLRSHPRKKAKAVQEPDSKSFLNAGRASVTFPWIPLLPAECNTWNLTTFVKKKNITTSNQVFLCVAAEYQRSLSVPISIFVEDTDSPSSSIDLSVSLDLRRHVSTFKTNDISESPPSSSSILSWVCYHTRINLYNTSFVPLFGRIWLHWQIT